MKEIRIRKASPDEFDRVMDIYYDIIDTLGHSDNSPKWTRGLYPTEDMIRGHIEKGDLYTATLEGSDEFAGAMVLNYDQAEGYEKVDWPVQYSRDEVMMLHLLGVRPGYMRQGIATEMVREAKRIARDSRAKSIRLDVVIGKEPAVKLYESEGFRYMGNVELYYEDTGTMEFMIFELIL